MTHKDQCREAFEAWVMRNPRPGTHLDRSHNGYYKDNRVNAKWAAWQAARSAPAALVALPQGDGWMPIESAPKDGSEILLVSRKGRIANGCWMTANDRRGTWMWPYVMVEPTHWMPLPQPPKEQT